MEDPYLSLRKQLDQEEWPNVYMFKFIVPNTSEKVALTMELFNNESDITMHESSTGKFISITARELMLDVDSIIKIYEEATKIKGLMAL
jgi:putative lipoic acid-binding regulatory protein